MAEWHRINIKGIITTRCSPQCIEPDTQPCDCLIACKLVTLHSCSIWQDVEDAWPCFTKVSLRVILDVLRPYYCKQRCVTIVTKWHDDHVIRKDVDCAVFQLLRPLWSRRPQEIINECGWECKNIVYTTTHPGSKHCSIAM